jgi:hypothetical protein
MAESHFPEGDDDITEPEAPSSEEASKDLDVDVSDADANSVVGGRKAGEGQKDYT